MGITKILSQFVGVYTYELQTEYRQKTFNGDI